MDDTVLIDLGDVREAPKPVLDRPASALRRRIRGSLAVLVGALLLLGSATPVRSDLVEVRIPAELGDGFFTTGDRLYVISPDSGAFSIDARTVSAYDLPEGRLLWEAALPTGGGAVRRLTATADTLVFTVETVQGNAVLQTVALDLHTARLLWRRSGDTFTGATFDGLLLLRHSGPTEPGVIGQPETWQGIEPYSGRARWRFETPPGAYSYIDWMRTVQSRLFVALPSGRVEVRDPRTGGLVAATQMAQDRDRAEAPLSLTPAGDLLLATQQFATRTLTTAYGAAGLDRRWQAESGPEAFLSPCGVWLCGQIAVSEGGRVWVADPATGRTRWDSDRWSSVTPLDPAGNRLLATIATDGSNPFGRLAVLDSATGDPLVELGDWRALEYELGVDGKLLLVRHDLFARTARLGLLDPVTLTLRTLGQLSEVGEDCQTWQEMVICRRLDASIGVWSRR